MVSVSASVNLSLHHKVQKFLFWNRLTRVVPEKGRKTVVMWWWCDFRLVLSPEKYLSACVLDIHELHVKSGKIFYIFSNITGC